MSEAANNGAATEGELGILHKEVAKALTDMVQETAEDEDTGAVKRMVSPAVLGAAIAFLKNNNITASPEQNAALSDLNKQLQARRRKGAVTPAAMDQAASDFADRFGGGLMQ